jgi:lysophospholipase L1-like esterase
MWMACLLIAFETAVQIRSYFRNGESVLNALAGEALYVTDERTRLKVLSPNHVFHRDGTEIRTNELGLRSPSIFVAKPPNTVRIAVIGASTAMGLYAVSNEETFSYQLGKFLEASHPSTHIEVINAGISGYGLTDQSIMLEKIVLPLKPDIVIVYSGFNDFADYCRGESGEKINRARIQRVGVPLIELPSWLLSSELIHKNTVALRSFPANGNVYRSAATVDLSLYKKKLEELIQVAKRGNVKLVVSTNARAFRRDQSQAEQEALSETARYYNPCFDTAGLHTLHERHNNAILELTRSRGVQSVRLDELIPGGRRYFVDASHFSNEGEKKAAEHLRRFLDDSSLLADH